MTKMIARKMALTLAALMVVSTAACSTSQVADNTGAVVGAAAKGTVYAVSGVGKLAVRGVDAAFGGE